MIKCIISDIDGTLLMKGERQLSIDVREAVQQALDKGITVVAASGRPYLILKELWAEQAEQMIFICANGTLTMRQGQMMAKEVLDKKLAKQMAESVLQTPGCELLISTPRYCYIQPKTDSYRQRIVEKLQYPSKEFSDFEEIEDEILQISVCREDGIEKSSEIFQKLWGEKAQVFVSGEFWMDFTPTGVNKGTALEKLMQLQNLQKEEVVAFGDSYNDIAMLKLAGLSYAVDWAPEIVKQWAKAVTQSPAAEIKRLLAIEE